MILTGVLLPSPDGFAPGWIEVRDGSVHRTGRGPWLGVPPAIDLVGFYCLPGLVDMHVHGGGGAAFTTGDPDEAEVARAFHTAAGTTRMVASLVTASVPDLKRSLTGLAPLVKRGRLSGLHLEGPFLAPGRCGAHQAHLLRRPTLDLVDGLLEAGNGTVRMVTLAPELPGAAAALRRFLDAGVVVAIGHTDATYDEARAAFDAGASVATHLFNAMAPLGHREPGPVLAALDSDHVTVEVVNDGLHLHPAVVRHVLAAVGPDRVALVTDAIAAAGQPDGRYSLGEVNVDVNGGRVRVAGTDTIAGSTLTLLAAVRRAVAAGIGFADAVRCASRTPATALGLASTELVVGARADCLLVDRDHRLRGVLAAGAWIGPQPGDL